MSHEIYSKNYLNEVIFQIRFPTLLKLYTDKKDAASDFQNVVGNEFTDVDFKQEKKLRLLLIIQVKRLKVKLMMIF